MAVSYRIWKWIPTATVGVTVTLATPNALAFFPPIPVGSGPVTVVPPPPEQVFPTDPVSPPVIPVVPPPPFVPPPPPLPVDPPVDPVNPPSHVVPEPGTLISSALGLVAIGGVVWRRRQNGRK